MTLQLYFSETIKMKTIFTLLIGLLFSIPNLAHGGVIHSGWSEYSKLIAEVSALTDVPATDLATIAALESSFKASAKAKRSTATGLFQFTDRTWRVTLRSYGKLYGLSDNAKRTDPRANALMGAEYIKENYRVLSRKMDREPDLVDVYMAHLIAPRRVAALEDINPNVDIAVIYPRLAKANPNIFFDKGKVRTVKSFQDLIARKVTEQFMIYYSHARIAVEVRRTRISAVLWTSSKEGFSDIQTCNSNPYIREFGFDFSELYNNVMQSEDMMYVPTLSHYSKLVSGDNRAPHPSGIVSRTLFADRRVYV